jgi:hypothetical protein
MNFFGIFVHIHSILRWVLLFFLLASIIAAVMSRFGVKKPNCNMCSLARNTMVLAHFQLLIGLGLYFSSPKVIFSAAAMKDAVLRFFLVEHPAMMLLAIILLTIGYIKTKRAEGDKKKSRLIMIFFTSALILILAAIPWPFLNYGGKWM